MLDLDLQKELVRRILIKTRFIYHWDFYFLLFSSETLYAISSVVRCCVVCCCPCCISWEQFDLESPNFTWTEQHRIWRYLFLSHYLCSRRRQLIKSEFSVTVGSYPNDVTTCYFKVFICLRPQRKKTVKPTLRAHAFEYQLRLWLWRERHLYRMADKTVIHMTCEFLCYEPTVGQCLRVWWCWHTISWQTSAVRLHCPVASHCRWTSRSSVRDRLDRTWTVNIHEDSSVRWASYTGLADHQLWVQPPTRLLKLY